jgi:hypothetical protein
MDLDDGPGSNDEGRVTYDMEWITKLPGGAMHTGRIDPSLKDDDSAFVVDFTRRAMKVRLDVFQ